MKEAASAGEDNSLDLLSNVVVLTRESNFILKPFAWIMGIILNAIYEFVSLFGIHNIAICIIIFTFVTKMLMLPLTIKQQKATKLSSRMNPELTKIQAKYKGKRDEASMRKMQVEQQAVYEKYGANPMSGCLPLLISLPIMFALYRVIYSVPAYVNDIKALYEGIAVSVQNTSGYVDAVASFVKDNTIAVSLAKFTEYEEAGMISVTHLIDVFKNFTETNWQSFFDISIFSHLESIHWGSVEEILSNNNFLTMSILETPSLSFPTILIPIFSAGFQILQSKLTTINQSKGTTKTVEENPTAQSMKMMTTIMPIFSGFICFMIPIGVGIYWIASSVVQIIQQLFVNGYLDKIDVDEMIAQNVAKSNKKKAKLGVETGSSKMSAVARTATKKIETEELVSARSEQKSTTSSAAKKKDYEASNYKRSDVSYSAGSIMANANLLKNRNLDGKSAKKIETVQNKPKAKNKSEEEDDKTAFVEREE